MLQAAACALIEKPTTLRPAINAARRIWYNGLAANKVGKALSWLDDNENGEISIYETIADEKASNDFAVMMISVDFDKFSQTLPARRRRVFDLARRGLNKDDISKTMNISTDTVRQQLSLVWRSWLIWNK